jgi:CheY-like chemotaxis protein
MGRSSLPSVILLVEDEPVLRASMARGLGKLSNVNVLAAASFNEAVTLLEAYPPTLLISDIDLPDNSGLELVAELNRRGINIPVIFVTAFLRTYKSQIPDNPKVLVLEKPIPLGELRAQATQLLGPAGDSLHTPFGMIDYIQLSCLGRHSVSIDVEFIRGAGRVVAHDGAVWSAVDDQGTGEEAFSRLAFATDGVVTCSPLMGKPGPRTITTRWEVLVLESARIFDEAQRDNQSTGMSCEPALPPVLPAPAIPGPKTSARRAVPPPLPPSAKGSAGRAPTFADVKAVLPSSTPLPQRVPAPLARPVSRTRASAPSARPAREATYEELWKQGVEALLNREFHSALRAFKAADVLQPGEPRILANLARLEEMGYSSDFEGDDF